MRKSLLVSTSLTVGSEAVMCAKWLRCRGPSARTSSAMAATASVSMPRPWDTSRPWMSPRAACRRITTLGSPWDSAHLAVWRTVAIISAP